MLVKTVLLLEPQRRKTVMIIIKRLGGKINESCDFSDRPEKSPTINQASPVVDV